MQGMPSLRLTPLSLVCDRPAAVQAKTSIPGLGKPITAVDVTFDGRWILATTDDYLMVVKASFNDDGGWEWWGGSGGV